MQLRGMDNSSRAFILPFYGEFGWLILHYVRYVDAHPGAEKIVCCRKGDECLYPSATGFYYEWENPYHDIQRSGDTGYTDSAMGEAMDRRIREQIKDQYSGFTVVRPEYDCYWHTSDLVKPKLAIEHELPSVDVAIAVRKRAFVPEANFNEWPEVIRILRGVGLTVGLLGRADTSFTDLEADAAAWEHPGKETAGTLDLLNHSTLYLGTDTGVSHLAAMLDRPMIVWYIPRPNGWNLLGLMVRANKGFFKQLPDSPGDVDQIVGSVVRYMVDKRTRGH